jgi:1A family penicillin-binding protein
MLVLAKILIGQYRSRQPELTLHKGEATPRKRGFSWRYCFWFFMSASLFTFILLFFILGTISLGCYYYFQMNLPVPTRSAMLAMPESTRIYDRHGVLLYELHGDVKRRFVPLSEIPESLRLATIAIEDKNFYKHKGYDLQAIARAFYINYKHKGISQGASTITQQLARTMFLDQERAYIRKIRELLLAIEIEKRYSKDEILEMYLNNIPYGSIAYGVSAAAEIYLDKSVKDLGLMESAYLAALPKAPSDYSPFGSNRSALDRRALEVLAAMQALAYLDSATVQSLVNQPLPHFVSPPHVIKAPHFVFYALEELEKQYGHEELMGGGLEVYTSLDLAWQREAERVVEKWGEINEKKYAAGNAALTAVDPTTGEILAMVGSRDYFEPGSGTYNAAISPRQPGSSFKPYVYATAFSNGMNPDTKIVDSRTDFAAANYGVSYVPQNYSGRHYGTVTARKALAGSLNVPAVKTIVSVGVPKTIDLAERLGISTLTDRKRFGPALALGGGEVKLLEHTAAMGAFGNGGRKQPLVSLLSIKNRSGVSLYQHKPGPGIQAVDEKAAFYIADILSDRKAREFIFGPRNKLVISGHRVAAKTGTTQDFHDAWTVGFTPSIAVGVWTGNNDNKPMKAGADGSYVAAPIWNEFMSFALGRVAKKDFAVPRSLLAKDKVKKDTGVLEKKESANMPESKAEKPGIKLVPAANAMSNEKSEEVGKETLPVSPSKEVLVPKPAEPGITHFELSDETGQKIIDIAPKSSGALIKAPCESLDQKGVSGNCLVFQ